jgi:2-oxoglutarate dehydrogenase E2 component (dihydrolipoamide succinyltransferase)
MIDVFVPKMENEGQDVYIVDWFKKVGESISECDPLLEIMTDKANIEIPSPASGILTARNFEIDDRVTPGAALASIDPV